ncbi:MAG TPA: YdeI/OmpD-associated family protein [Fimbriimonas sp.]
MTAAQRFLARLKPEGKNLVVALPFDPSEAWGPKERHHIAGTVAGHPVRGPLTDGRLLLGPAWVRDHPIPTDQEVEIVLQPEGPQLERLSPDLADALESEPDARAFFNSLATFYRKGYVNWIESAKRPETRERRIREAVALLRQGRKQR